MLRERGGGHASNTGSPPPQQQQLGQGLGGAGVGVDDSGVTFPLGSSQVQNPPPHLWHTSEDQLIRGMPFEDRTRFLLHNFQNSSTSSLQVCVRGERLMTGVRVLFFSLLRWYSEREGIGPNGSGLVRSGTGTPNVHPLSLSLLEASNNKSHGEFAHYPSSSPSPAVDTRETRTQPPAWPHTQADAVATPPVRRENKTKNVPWGTRCKYMCRRI